MKNTVDTSKIKILICCHKQVDLPENPDDIFLPVHVGAAISNVNLTYNGKPMLRDDQVNGNPCENISKKNKTYCELTAMYWLWKNLDKIAPDAEYIGLNHYRRYFSFTKKNLFEDAVIEDENKVTNYRINTKKLCKYLKKYDCITAKRRIYPYSLENDYKICHVSDDFKRLRIIIHEMYPEYDLAVVSALTCSNKLAPYNMNVIGRSMFKEYCTWLFSILEECEKEINIENYSIAQKRIFGYMAERLFNVWLLHNCKRIKRLNIIKYTDDKLKRTLPLWLSQAIRNIRCSFAFSNNKPLGSPRHYYDMTKDSIYNRKQLE